MSESWTNKGAWVRARRDLDEHGFAFRMGDSGPLIQAILDAACSDDHLRSQIHAAITARAKQAHENVLQGRERVLWGRFVRMLGAALRAAQEGRWESLPPAAHQLAQAVASISMDNAEKAHAQLVAQLEQIEALCVPLRSALKEAQVEPVAVPQPQPIDELRRHGVMTALTLLDRTRPVGT